MPEKDTSRCACRYEMVIRFPHPHHKHYMACVQLPRPQDDAIIVQQNMATCMNAMLQRMPICSATHNTYDALLPHADLGSPGLICIAGVESCSLHTCKEEHVPIQVKLMYYQYTSTMTTWLDHATYSYPGNDGTRSRRNVEDSFQKKPAFA